MSGMRSSGKSGDAMSDCLCDCCDKGKTMSGRTCICGGEGTCSGERVGLRKRILKAEDKLYQVAKYAACATPSLGEACNCIVCDIRREVTSAVNG